MIQLNSRGQVNTLGHGERWNQNSDPQTSRSLLPTPQPLPSSVTHSSKPLAVEYLTLKVSYILFKKFVEMSTSLKDPQSSRQSRPVFILRVWLLYQVLDQNWCTLLENFLKRIMPAYLVGLGWFFLDNCSGPCNTQDISYQSYWGEQDSSSFFFCPPNQKCSFTMFFPPQYLSNSKVKLAIPFYQIFFEESYFIYGAAFFFSSWPNKF